METQPHWNGSDAMQQIAPCFGVVDWQGVRPLPVAADWPVVTHQIAGLLPQRHLDLRAVKHKPLILPSEPAVQTSQVHGNELG